MADLKMTTEAANKKASENKKKHDEELAKERQRQAEIRESLKDRVDEREVENDRLRHKLSPLHMSVQEACIYDCHERFSFILHDLTDACVGGCLLV